MTLEAPRVLLVEDNQDLALGLHNNLEIEGYAVSTVQSGEQALDLIRSSSPDLVVLDLMLPGLCGMKVLQRCRKNGYQGPVLILTARGEESDKVRALKLGADDYLTKPFGLLELLARVEALLRRSAASRSPNEAMRLGELEIHPAQRQALLRGVPLDLTPKEYDLLFALFDARGAVVTRDRLLAEVWGYNESVYSRTVDTHIAELRRKIEADSGNPQAILTVRKAGYRLATEQV